MVEKVQNQKPDADFKNACQREAERLGFVHCGVASIPVDLRRDYYLRWIEEGKHGEMLWLERNNDRRLHPENILPNARSVLMLGFNYYQDRPHRRDVLARYALGKDYHKLIYKRLKKMCAWLREYGGAQKPYVDTGPLMEKPIAAQTGIGWQAKNTILTSKKYGPYLFLASIVTTLEIEPDEPIQDHCGRCRKCLDACPTGAITAPYQLDATRCLSYYSIEHPGAIPHEYREAMGNRIFGCDDCIDVCPWNRWAKQSQEIKFTPTEYPDIRDTLSWNDDDFHEHFQGTPVARLKLRRWKRNACIVLGNIGNHDDKPALEVLKHGEDEMLAEHAEWALERIAKRAEIQNS